MSSDIPTRDTLREIMRIAATAQQGKARQALNEIYEVAEEEYDNLLDAPILDSEEN